MNQITQALKEIGFTAKESLVYTVLLSCGSASAYTLAEKTGLKAPTTYLTLQNLIEKGFVYNLPRAKKKLFIAKNPEELIKGFEEKMAQTKKLLPEMLSLIPADASKLKVQYFQGLKGIKESLEYGFKNKNTSKEIVGFFSSAEGLSSESVEISRQFISKLKNKGVKVRGITPDHKSTKEIQEFNQLLGNEVRTIPYDEYSAQASIESQDSYIRIVLFKEQLSVIIDNPELAKMVKQIFEMIWKRK